MSRRFQYRYCDAAQHTGVPPRQLRQLLRSECELRQSLDSLARWRVDLYGIREGWVIQWDGAPRSITHEEIYEAEAECDALQITRVQALKSVLRALTTAVDFRVRRA